MSVAYVNAHRSRYAAGQLLLWAAVVVPRLRRTVNNVQAMAGAVASRADRVVAAGVEPCNDAFTVSEVESATNQSISILQTPGTPVRTHTFEII